MLFRRGGGGANPLFPDTIGTAMGRIAQYHKRRDARWKGKRQHAEGSACSIARTGHGAPWPHAQYRTTTETGEWGWAESGPCNVAHGHLSDQGSSVVVMGNPAEHCHASGKWLFSEVGCKNNHYSRLCDLVWCHRRTVRATDSRAILAMPRGKPDDGEGR